MFENNDLYEIHESFLRTLREHTHDDKKTKYISDYQGDDEQDDPLFRLIATNKSENKLYSSNLGFVSSDDDTSEVHHKVPALLKRFLFTTMHLKFQERNLHNNKMNSIYHIHFCNKMYDTLKCDAACSLRKFSLSESAIRS